MKTFKPNSANTIVKAILTSRPETRDDDQLLYIAYMVANGYSPINCSVDFLFTLIKEKRLQCLSVIARRRRGLQRLFPELRGKRYGNRQKVQQKSFKEEFGYPESLDYLDTKIPGATP